MRPHPTLFLTTETIVPPFVPALFLSLAIGNPPFLLLLFDVEPWLARVDMRDFYFAVKRLHQPVQGFGYGAVVIFFDGLQITLIAHFLDVAHRPGDAGITVLACLNEHEFNREH